MTSRDSMMNEDAKIAAVKTGAVGIAGALGMSLNDVVAILTAVFILLQIGLLIPKYWRMFVTMWQRWRA